MSSFLGLSQTIVREGVFRAYLHRSRFALLLHGRGPAARSTNRSSPGRPGPRAARHHPHPVLFARGARSHRSGCSAPYRAGCRPSCGLAEIATVVGRQPLPHQTHFVPDYNARFAVPATEEGSAFIAYAGRPARGRPVHPGNAARSAATIASIGTASPCRSRRSAIATTTSRRPCACTDIPTAGSPSSTGRAASPAFDATAQPINASRAA